MKKVRVWIHKVSSFEVPCGPMVYRNRMLREKNDFLPGDLIVLVGTRQAVALEDRGRMLGMMETAAMDVEGNARWPVGVANRAAWRFPGKPQFPLPNDATRFQTKAGQQAIPLSDTEADTILSAVPLEAREFVPLDDGAEHPKPRSRRRNGAPPPSQSRAAVEALNNGPASTYLFLLENTEQRVVGFKIGWAGDHGTRLAEFNLISMPGFGGLRYRPSRHWVWDTAQQAFDMEQALLKELAKYRTSENREVLCADSRTELERVWLSYLRQFAAGRR